jgi:hypothetical protein
MANSGIYWIDFTFDWCVRLLYQVAQLIGITYEEINVWLFVIVFPVFFVAQSLVIVILFMRLKRRKVDYVRTT